MSNTFYLQFAQKIDRWDEALPLGNGEMGALVFGGAGKLTVSLDRGDIWDRSNSPENGAEFTYAHLKKYKDSRNTRKIAKIFDMPYSKPTPSKLPVGKIVLEFAPGAEDCFGLDMQRAEACYRSGEYTFRTFLHATQGCGYIVTDIPFGSVRLVNPRYGIRRKWDAFLEKFRVAHAVSNKLKNVRYPKPMFYAEQSDGVQYDSYVQPLNDGTCYGVMIAKIMRAGKNEYCYYAALDANAEDLQACLKHKVSQGIAIGYQKAIQSHIDWWTAFFAQSGISLPDKYLERCYNMGNYLLGSGSRRGCYPMPLQGLWTACDDKYLPPWKGDYHHDLNTEMTYYSYLKANHLDAGLSFIDYIVSLTDRAREFARKFYGAQGLCLPAVMDIDGYALGGWAMYALSPTNQIWLCQLIERHYTYTGDQAFLQQVAFPYIQATARFICSLLVLNEDGDYVLPMSSSPEIHDNRLAAFLVPNSNYDQALILYLLETVIRLGKILNQDTSEWERYLSHTHALWIKDNVLMLDRKEMLQEAHRHMSHAMAIHPLRLYDYNKQTDRVVIDATVNYTRSLGNRFYTGYSYAWLAEFEVVRRNGDEAYKLLDIFYRHFCSPNTFHLNGDYRKQGYSSLTYRPFTLEGNFCAIDAIQESLLYSENNTLLLFPAVPKSWQDVAFHDFRACGGALVSATMRGGQIVSLVIRAACDVTYRIGNASETLCDEIVQALSKDDNGLWIRLKKGEVFRAESHSVMAERG